VTERERERESVCVCVRYKRKRDNTHVQEVRGEKYRRPIQGWKSTQTTAAAYSHCCYYSCLSLSSSPSLPCPALNPPSFLTVPPAPVPSFRPFKPASSPHLALLLLHVSISRHSCLGWPQPSNLSFPPLPLQQKLQLHPSGSRVNTLDIPNPRRMSVGLAADPIYYSPSCSPQRLSLSHTPTLYPCLATESLTSKQLQQKIETNLS
jgi:hypothetical protein